MTAQRPSSAEVPSSTGVRSPRPRPGAAQRWRRGGGGGSSSDSSGSREVGALTLGAAPFPCPRPQPEQPEGPGMGSGVFQIKQAEWGTEPFPSGGPRALPGGLPHAPRLSPPSPLQWEESLTRPSPHARPVELL